MKLSRSLCFLPLVLGMVISARGQAASPPEAPTAPAAADSGDLAKQLADAQDKLATSLQSYTLLQDENSELKAAAEKSAAEKSALTAQIEDAAREIAALKTRAAAASQLDSLHTQVRQLQDEVDALASENVRLKTRLAVRGPSPAGGMPTPTRPANP